MTQCFVAFMVVRASLHPSTWTKAERIIDEAREKAHTCPIFRGLPPSDWYLELPVADDLFVEDFGSLDIMGGHVFTDGSGGAETKDLGLRRCRVVFFGAVACSVRWEEELA